LSILRSRLYVRRTGGVPKGEFERESLNKIILEVNEVPVWIQNNYKSLFNKKEGFV
jgi:hypothetical protein